MQDSVDGRNNMTSVGSVQSVERALRLLSELATQPDGMSLGGLSARVGLHASTAHRLLATLVALDYVKQDASTRAYRLGLEALRVGVSASLQLDVRDEAREALAELAKRAGELANLAVCQEDQAVYIAQANPVRQRTMQMFSQLGAAVPLYCTGIGKAILAQSSAEAFERYVLKHELGRRTVNTITSPLLLHRELELTRMQGYAVDNEEYELGVRCVASPIWDATGSVRGAISISGPSGRVLPEHDQSLGQLVSQFAEQVSRRLGHRAGDTTVQGRGVPAQLSRLRAE